MVPNVELIVVAENIPVAPSGQATVALEMALVYVESYVTLVRVYSLTVPNP